MFFFLLLAEPNLKAHFNLVLADIMTHILSREEGLQIFCFFPYLCLNKFSSAINVQSNGSIKSLPCSGLLLPSYEIIKLGVPQN